MADPFLTELKREVVLRPDDPAPRFKLAEALFVEAQYDAAARQLEKVLQLAPDFANARRMLTRAYERGGKPALAVKALTDALARDPLDADARDELVELMLAAGRPDDATLHAEAAVKAAPDDPRRLAVLGELLARKRHFGRARELLERASRLAPEDARVRRLLEELYLELGDEAAVERVAGARDPAYLLRQTAAALELPAVRARLTGALQAAAQALKAQDPAAAKRALVSAAPEEKASAVFSFLRGELFLREQELDKAEAAFRAAVERDGGLGVAWNRLGDLQRTRGALKEALPLYERAVQASPDDAHAHEDLGDVLATLGELDRARAAYEAAVARAPEGRAAEKLRSLLAPSRAVTSDPVVGRIHALGWNAHGGAVSPLQAVAVPGSGQLIFSGNVGPVGREAGQIAFSLLKSRALELGILDAVRTHDLHLHYEDTEFSKEGPSAGLALVLVGISAYTGRKLLGALAASGEITLHGEVRPVGGIHEKLVAARLHGIRTVLVPRRNLREVRELPAEVREQLELVHVDSVAEALDKVLRKD